MKKKHKIKTCVRLREKPLRNGARSLYLDIYHNGERSYEFLKLYINDEKSASVRDQNKETYCQAEKIRAERESQILNNKDYAPQRRNKTDLTLLQFIDNYISKLKKRSESLQGYVALRHIVESFGKCKGLDLRASTINRNFATDFIQYINSLQLATNTIYVYLKYLQIAIHDAIRNEQLDNDPFRLLTPQELPRKEPSHRQFLTLHEIRQLEDTFLEENKGTNIREAFLFSCFSGLRLSDIITLKDEDFETSPSGACSVSKRMKKTKCMVRVPISNRALQYLPPHKSDELIFHLPTRATICLYLRKWCKAAGINKKITFHCARHSFATNLLTTGSDIYTVSKLLGHSNVSTTQIYAKIVDSKKEEAIRALSDAFEKE